MKLYSVLYDEFHPFDKWKLFDTFEVVTNPDHLKANDGMLIVHGGADIHPSLYNKGRSSFSGAPRNYGGRDMVEWECMKKAVELGMPIFGICRGAQMLCALAGGYLVQHVDNHGGRDHQVHTAEGDTIVTNTCHHQQMYPFDVPHVMLGWTDKRSTVYMDVDTNIDQLIEVDTEAVYFPEVKGLAVQWHPEWLPSTGAQADKVKHWVKNYAISNRP